MVYGIDIMSQFLFFFERNMDLSKTIISFNYTFPLALDVPNTYSNNIKLYNKLFKINLAITFDENK